MTAIDSTTVPAPPVGTSHAAADFLVTWEQPGDDQRFWTHERWGIAVPITPLSFAFTDLIYGGMNAGAAAYSLPTRVAARRINTFLYMSEDPSSPTADAADDGQRAEQLLNTALTTLGERWDADWLPEVQRHLAYWEGYDLAAAPLPALRHHLDDTIGRLQRLWEIHFLIIFPMLLAISEFDELYRELMGGEDSFDSYRLLQGLDNRTVDSGRALWDLSRRALAAPPVRSALRDSAPAGVLADLEASPEGVAFLAELRPYLAEYGQRSNNPLELGESSWIEDPTPVLATLREYIDQPDRDVAAERAELVAERERAIAATRSRLTGYPRPVVEQFELLLKGAQVATVLSEDHAFWIDLCGLYQARRVAVEIGRRLADAQAIPDAGDVFYLTLDEVREALDGRPARNAPALVASRKAEMEYYRTITPPPAIGSAPPESQADDPLSRAMAKFMGAPPPVATEPGVVLGIAGSPGIVRGTAKVVLTLADAGKLQPGDILVTEYTGPWWTPLFGIAGALVTDFGGVLSHCAIVAREFGIPAVVGAGSATTTLLDGQLIEVDGDQGIVRVIANP
ncbi:MAG TPA: PEP-utilizing enzyme [Thermomicrobiales bacterium]|nr:PEP-utilizing enzyme [Thermomicrobiales bacterium]